MSDSNRPPRVNSSRCATFRHGIQNPRFPVSITITSLHDLSRQTLITLELVLSKVDFCANPHSLLFHPSDNTPFRQHRVSTALPLQTSLPTRDFMRSTFILPPTAFLLRSNQPHSNRSCLPLPTPPSLTSVGGYQPLLLRLSRFSRDPPWFQPLRTNHPLLPPQT